MASRHRKFVATITDEEYDAVLALQGGHCAICPTTPKSRRLDRDHDHATMELRGLLCHRCNRRLDTGATVEWLVAAQRYLAAPPAGRLARALADV